MLTTKSFSSIDVKETNEQILQREIIQMLENSNPLTGIYSIYGDYPIDPNPYVQERMKKLERMNVTK